MTTYTAALEALDAKMGRVHTIDDWRRVGEKSQLSPATLTDDDLVIIGGFDGEPAVARARARRAEARTPSLPEPVTVAKSAAAPAASGSVEFPDCLWKRDAPDLVKEMDRWSESQAMKALPILLWWKYVSAGRENRQALEKTVATLEQRIAALEAKPHVKFCGVWEPGRTYAPGDAATMKGSLWICKAATPGAPGVDFIGWTLAVKRGQAV